MRKIQVTGFSFGEIVMPIAQKETVKYEVYSGNFYFELRLPPALKIKSFWVLREKVNNYLKIKGRLPDCIVMTKKQRDSYYELYPKHIRTSRELTETNIQYGGIKITTYN